MPLEPPKTGSVLVLPRLSLSELMHASALVRELCDRHGWIVVLTARRVASHVRHLFADIGNLRFRFVDSWAGARPLVHRAEAEGMTVIPLPSYRESCPYAAAGLDREMAWTRFQVSRESEGRQRALLCAVRDSVGNEYVVVHDVPGRELRRDLVPDMPTVHVRDFPTASPFDWIQVMDHAAQIHAIDSHFLQLADKLDLRASKYCHAYVTETLGRWVAGAYGTGTVMMYGG